MIEREEDCVLIRFMTAELLVAPGTLAPREETELLGHAAVQAIRGLGVEVPSVVDMCCGTGNLACGIALCLPEAQIWCSDCAELCVEVARRNVDRLALSNRVKVCRGDLFAGLHGLGLEGRIHAVVCNPPYISQTLLNKRTDLLEREPREAFDGGPYGLTVHQRVIREAARYLRWGGVLLCEIGLGQHRQVEHLLQRALFYDGIRFIANAAGEPRVVMAQRKHVPG